MLDDQLDAEWTVLFCQFYRVAPNELLILVAPLGWEHIALTGNYD